MATHVAVGLAALSLVAMGGLYWQLMQQQDDIKVLSGEIRALKEQLEPGPATARSFESAPSPGEGTPSRPEGAAARPVTNALPSADPSVARAPSADVAARRQQPLESPEQVHSALVEMLESDDPEIRSRMRDLIRTEREEERDERRQQRQHRWEQETLDRLDRLAAEQHLTASQQDALFAILTVARDRITEAFRQAREDHSVGEAQEKIEKYRAEADAEARDLLNDDQYAAYKQMRDKELERRGFRRDRAATPAP